MDSVKVVRHGHHESKFPLTVLVPECVPSDIMPPNTFELDLRLNSAAGDVVNPWLNRMAAGFDILTSVKSQRCLLGNFHGFASPNFWPP